MNGRNLASHGIADEDFQVRFGRSFTLPFPLHGLFERCLVQLHRLYTPRRHWRGEALLAGSGSVRIFAQLRDCAPTTNQPSQSQKLTFFFAAENPDDIAEARAALSSVMFIVHNFLQGTSGNGFLIVPLSVPPLPLPLSLSPLPLSLSLSLSLSPIFCLTDSSCKKKG
jgi:hypothetical protein